MPVNGRGDRQEFLKSRQPNDANKSQDTLGGLHEPCFIVVDHIAQQRPSG